MHQRSALVARYLARRQLIKAFGSVNASRMLSTTCARSGYGSGVPGGGELQELPIKCDIGSREVVGYGLNGDHMYIETMHAPFPAIRFKEESPEISAIRAKEQGDWKKMTLHEKKELYRFSYCQTIVEYNAPTGEWKKISGIALFFISLGIWGVIWLKMFVYDPQPTTISDEEYQKAQIKRMIDMRVNPIDGFASRYDYENNKWKDGVYDDK